MSRRKIESSIGPTEESPQQTSERKSVFERLGRIVDIRRVVTNHEYEEKDLRFKVRRKQTNSSHSPKRSVSPQIQHKTVKSNHSRSDDKFDTKVKSLVVRSESPTTHTQSVSSTVTSSVSSHKRSTHRSSDRKFVNEDIDDEEIDLEKKRLQLQKELQELETSGSLEQKNISPTLNVPNIRSRSPSIVSTESESYSSSIKSFSKTESTCSSLTDKKSNNNKDVIKTKDNNKTSVKKTQVSSSISRSVSKASNLDESKDSGHKKSNELKFDRHGNLRISLDEQERQKRIRAERFSDKLSPIDSNKKKSTDSKGFTSRDHSYSPPVKRSRDSLSKDKSKPVKRLESSERSKSDRNDNRRDNKSKNITTKSSRYDGSPKSKNSENKEHRKVLHEEHRNKGSDRSRRSSLLSVSPNNRGRRDRSRDSRFSDRDNTSVKKNDNFSRDRSPTHSSHSKISRDSSIGSDFSRSKSERHSVRSSDKSTHSQNVDHKSEVKTREPLIEEMSPISADSSLPDVIDVDSVKNEQKIIESQENVATNRVRTNRQNESDFSDWSEGEDELLLKNDGFETVDEVKNISDNSQEKDVWNDEKCKLKSKSVSCESLVSESRDDALEAISDDELDAIIGETEPIDSTTEPKKNRQMLDSLDIDWGSLVSETKQKPEYISGSARKRFTPANVLMRIGFSHAFAGPLMTERIVDFCQKELKDEFVPFRHPMAAVHSLINYMMKERLYLFGVDNTHSTALSGRKDLQIRKMLNKSSLKIFDNSQTSIQTTNDFSVSLTNVKESNLTDIQCI